MDGTFEQRWVIIKERLDKIVVRPLQTFVEIDPANYEPTLKMKPMHNSQWTQYYGEIYELCTAPGLSNFSDPLYTRFSTVFDSFYTFECIPRLLKSISSDLDLFYRQFHRCLCAHDALMNHMTIIFKYLKRYHVKYHHLPTIDEVGSSSFVQNVLDPLFQGCEDLEVLIIVTHTLNVMCPRRQITMAEFNHSIYRHLYPNQFWFVMREKQQRMLADTHAAVLLFQLKREELTVHSFSMDEFLVKNWLDTRHRLPEAVKIHILAYLAPVNLVRVLLPYVQ